MVGLGVVVIEEAPGQQYFEHNGGNEGFRCTSLGSMKGGNGVVVMVNSDNEMILQEIVNSVFSVYGWDRFNQAVKKIVSLTPQQWKSLDGLYALESDKNLHLQLTSKNDKLILKQVWDGKEVTFEAESEVEFFCRDFHFPQKFTRECSGRNHASAGRRTGCMGKGEINIILLSASLSQHQKAGKEKFCKLLFSESMFSYTIPTSFLHLLLPEWNRSNSTVHFSVYTALVYALTE